MHPTMDEYFFVLSGCGEYTINNIKHNITKGDFIFIPAGVKHFLKTKNKNGLELVYFGVKK